MPENTKAPLRGKLSEKHKSPVRKPIPLFKIGWGFLGALFLVSLSVWFYLGWYGINEYCTRSPQIQNVKVGLTAPAFLSVGDEAQFLVTVVNERNTAAKLSLELRYIGTSLCSAAPEESHRINFGPIQPGERTSRKISVLFPICLKDFTFRNWPGKQAEFEVWLTVDDQPPERIDTVPLPIAPIPRASTLGKWTAGWLAGLALWTGKELWELIKKTAEPSISKAKSRA